MCWITAFMSGRWSTNHFVRAANSGKRAMVSGPRVETANSGTSPTSECARNGSMRPSAK